MTAITLKKIRKEYDKKRILNDINLDIQEGKIFGILGTKECGKSTLIKIIAGILKPDLGECIILGEQMPSRQMQSKIGYMEQNSALYENLTGYENILFYAKMHKIKDPTQIIESLSETFGLSEILGANVFNFSHDSKQILLLIIALICQPKVLILDEPTDGIDPSLRHEIWQELFKIAKAGTTIIIATHLMEEAEKCHSLAIMSDGTIIATGSPTRLQKNAKARTLEKAFIHYRKAIN